MSTQHDFAGKNALVTGGATGIGKGCAEFLLSTGASVTIAGPDQPAIDAALAELGPARRSDARLKGVLCDVTEEEQVKTAVGQAAEGGHLDIVVSNAGTGYPAPILSLDAEGWLVPFRVNVMGTAFCIKHAAKVMRSHGGGSIVAISTVEALRAPMFMAPYPVSKAGVDALVRCAARELATFRIRVNGVRPGYVDTDSARAAFDADMVQSCLDSTWIKRAGQPADIAHAVGFLVSDHADWVTGEMLNVDGGFGVHDGEDFEYTARMVVGDAAVDDAKGES